MKKTKRFIYAMLIAVSALLYSSCSNEMESELADTPSTERIVENDPLLMARVFSKENNVSEETAKKLASSLMNDFGENDLTRSSASPSIKNIEILDLSYFQNLKNSDIADLPDTLAYIVNFEDDQGYMIISADRRLGKDIIGQSSKGNLHYKDAWTDPNTGGIFDYIEEWMYSSFKEASFLKDSLQQVIAKDIEKINQTTTRFDEQLPIDEFPLLEYYVYYRDITPYSTTKKVGPLAEVEWGQSGVFNMALENNGCYGNGKYPVGCVPVMVAQVMSYYKHPNSIQGVSIDWNLLNQYTGWDHCWVLRSS